MNAWVNEPPPVFLVIYDATSDRAWWIHLAHLRTIERRCPERVVGQVTVIRPPHTTEPVGS